jgi:hypothetical protein
VLQKFSCSGCPLMPPAALISSTAAWAPGTRYWSAPGVPGPVPEITTNSMGLPLAGVLPVAAVDAPAPDELDALLLHAPSTTASVAAAHSAIVRRCVLGLVLLVPAIPTVEPPR